MGYLIKLHGLLISIVGIELETNTTDCRCGAQGVGEAGELRQRAQPRPGGGEPQADTPRFSRACMWLYVWPSSPTLLWALEQKSLTQLTAFMIFVSGIGLGHNLCLGNAGYTEKEASPQTNPMPIPATPLANPAPKILLPLLTWSHS